MSRGIRLILFHQINMTADHMIENHQRCAHLNIILHSSYILMQISSYNLAENEDNGWSHKWIKLHIAHYLLFFKRVLKEEAG